MVDHDEFLPEEQAHPALVRQLQTIYLMKPAEKQVLSRVHQRLVQSSHLLPQPSPVQAGSQARLLQFRPATATAFLPARAGQRWLRPRSILAAVLLLGLLLGSLVLTVAMIERASMGSPAVTTIFLVPAQRAPSHTELEVTSSILSMRFSNFGLKGFSVQVAANHGQPGILVEMPQFSSSEQSVIDTLLGTGELDFWGTGKTTVPAGTLFNPGQYAQDNPGGQPPFTGQDLDPNSLATTPAPETGQPQITGMMNSEAIQRFQSYTAENVGNSLTITLDGKVLQSAIIVRSISRSFVIRGPFTQQQARAIVSALKYGTLPVELQQQS